jgi:hypothetical protein
MSKHDLTAQVLRESIDYNAETGVFKWSVNRKGARAGKLIACPETKPKPTISINYWHYSVMQLAWLYTYGEFPSSRIIAVNGNRCDARLSNLMKRAAQTGKLTAERLRELVHYDPETGLITRKVRTSNRIKVGEVCGSPNTDGYLVMCIGAVKHAIHRLAWLYMTGSFPPEEIDHINGIRNDNRWCNLREANRSQNTQNTHKRRRADGGFVGVQKSGSVWKARIQVDKTLLLLGTYETIEEALEVYLAAKRVYHPTNTLAHSSSN